MIGPLHASSAFAFLILSLATTPSPAFAQTVSAPTPPNGAPTLEPYKFGAPPRPKTHWYGWQTLMMDAIAVGMSAFANASNKPNLGVQLAGSGMFALGGPLVHVAHRAPGKAVGSLLLRASGPALMTYGAMFARSDSDLGLAVLGGMACTAAAITIDAAVLAHEKVDPTANPVREPAQQEDREEPVTTSSQRSSVHMSATFVPLRGGGTVGAIGTF
jgi:hypothetical protein